MNSDFFYIAFPNHYLAPEPSTDMHDSRPLPTDKIIPPVPKSAAGKFAMPPPPQSLQDQIAGPIFSIETATQTESAEPKIVIKTIEHSRKRSDPKLVLFILLVLSLIACALGTIVFLS
ncbi:MAG: hypothetical protein ABGW75_05090 [Pirellulales bacterium]|jgi:hypothetical protein